MNKSHSKYHTIPYHIISYHTIPYHTIPYHTIPYHTMPCLALPCHAKPYPYRIIYLQKQCYHMFHSKLSIHISRTLSLSLSYFLRRFYFIHCSYNCYIQLLLISSTFELFLPKRQWWGAVYDIVSCLSITLHCVIYMSGLLIFDRWTNYQSIYVVAWITSKQPMTFYSMAHVYALKLHKKMIFYSLAHLFALTLKLPGLSAGMGGSLTVPVA